MSPVADPIPARSLRADERWERLTVLDDRAAPPPIARPNEHDDVVAALEAALAVSGGLVDAAVRRLVRDAPVGFAVLDADLRYVLVNDFLVRFAGRPAEETVGATLREIVPSMADVAEAAFRHVLDTGEPIRDLALIGDVVGDPGRIRHWRESVFRVETSGLTGPEHGLAVLVWEATEQVEAQRTMLAAQDRLRFLARTSDVLSQSLDEGAVLAALARLLVPDVATGVVVLLPDGAGRLVPAPPGTRGTVPDADAVHLGQAFAAAGAFGQQTRIARGSSSPCCRLRCRTSPAPRSPSTTRRPTRPSRSAATSTTSSGSATAGTSSSSGTSPAVGSMPPG